ncbi:MAG: hypothetical protein RL077_342 [Verrucomicrobiota bacterium]|jgi:hypothetical protein
MSGEVMTPVDAALAWCDVMAGGSAPVEIVAALASHPHLVGDPAVAVAARILADEVRRLRASEADWICQRGNDSRELRALCAARDEARKERDGLRDGIREVLRLIQATLRHDGSINTELLNMAKNALAATEAGK